MPRHPIYLIKVLIKLFLLCVALLIAGCDMISNEPPDTSPVSEPTATLRVTQTANAIATIEIQLGKEERIEEYHFSYRPVANYEVIHQANGISMIDPDAESNNGPYFFLASGDYEQLKEKDSVTNVLITFAGQDVVTNLLANIADELVPEMHSVIGNPRPITVNDMAGKQLDLTVFGEEPVGGRITVLGKDESQLFVMVGLSPLERWDREVMPLYNEVLNNVTLFHSAVTQ